MTKDQLAELRAGIFTLIIMICFGVMVFFLGTQKGYFKPQITLKTKFLNVHGLKVGAPVRFMGVGIGQVKDVLLPKEGLRAEIEVLLQVDKSVQKNITQDSIATIKWLSYVTGDSYVEISTGAYREKFVEDGDTIRSEEPLNYSTVIEGGINIIESFSKMLKKLEEGKVVESLNNVSSSLNEGVVAFQKGEGLLHSLIYDPKGKQLFENVLQTSESFKEIMAMVENEEGTLGALIADPALYDNVKRLLGGAERSFVLRSLIRKSLEKGKEERKEIH